MTDRIRFEDERRWAYLRSLLERVARGSHDTSVDDCLDLLVEFFEADRGLVVLAEPQGSTCTVHARGKGRALSPYECEEISRTVIREVLDRGCHVLWQPGVERGDRLTESMISLGITAALAGPLPAVGSASKGVVYLDLRDVQRSVDEPQIEFFRAAVGLIGLALKGQSAPVAEELAVPLGPARSGPALHELMLPRSMSALRMDVEAAVHGDLPVLILGESGTGKTLLAHAIAEAGNRVPVVRVALGQSDDLNTLSSELFGHERGAFSGAVSRRVGLAEFADGGTLILDEIMNLPAGAQQLLLDFTQFGTYRSLGYGRPEPKRSTARIIAVTNGDLAAAVREKRFRADLFHRLGGLVLRLPPLRERREDIPFLAEAFLRRRDAGRGVSLSPDVRRALLDARLAWPGNIRQLELVLERARVRALASGGDSVSLSVDHLDLGERPAGPERGGPAGLSNEWLRLEEERERLEERERRLLDLALSEHGGVVARAAQTLGLPRTTLSSRLQSLRKPSE